MPEKNKIGSTASPGTGKDLIEKGRFADSSTVRLNVKDLAGKRSVGGNEKIGTPPSSGKSRIEELQTKKDVSPLSGIKKAAKWVMDYGSVDQQKMQRELVNLRTPAPLEIPEPESYGGMNIAGLEGAGAKARSIVANFSGQTPEIGKHIQDLNTAALIGGALPDTTHGAGGSLPQLMDPKEVAQTAINKNYGASQQDIAGMEAGNYATSFNDLANKDKKAVIENKKNIVDGYFDENNAWHEGYAIVKGYVPGPEGTINFVEADLGTAKSMMDNPYFPPEQMVFQIETSDDEFEKLVKDPRYSQYSIERTDTKEKKREREVARIEKRLGEEQVLVSEYFQGSISQNVMTRMAKFGLSALPPEMKKQVYESMDAAEKQFALNQSNYDRLQEQNQMSYLELAKKTGMTPVAAHSLKQEIGDILEILTPLVSMKSKREYHEDHAHLREIMSKSEGPYSQARDDYKAIIKDSKSSPAESDSAKRALKRIEDPNREWDDDVMAAYDVNGAFCSAISVQDEDFDLAKDAFIKGGLKTISDRMATKEERVAASQQIQFMAVAKTIKDTDLLKHLSTFDKNSSYNKLVSDKVKLLTSALASGDVDGVSTIMDELINKTYEKADDQGHKKGAKVYEIMVGPVKINPDTGEKDQEVLEATDDQKRQMFLTMCTPQAKSIMNAWNLVLDDPYDRNGQYSVDEDYVIQSINKLVAKGQTALARETVLNMRSIMKENDAIGLYGRSDKYLDTIDGMLGL